MRNLIKIACILLAFVLVFGVAKFLDSNDPFRPEEESSAQTQPSVRETAPPVTTEAPVETEGATEAPVETEASGETEASETIPAETQAPAGKQEFTLTLGGNCLLGGTLSSSYQEKGFLKTIGEDYGYPFRNLMDYFGEDDFTFLTLEAPLSDSSAYSSRQPVYSGPSAYGNILTKACIESVSLASDHIRDHGSKGYANTTKCLTDAGIHYAEHNTATVYTTQAGLRIGIYSTLCVGEQEHPDAIAEAIRELDKQADIVIFAPHWGVTGSYVPVEAQKNLAHLAVDAGADIVCGSHPSVLQPMETYETGLIFYSLGNLCTGAQRDPGDYDTAIVQLQVTQQSDGSYAVASHTLIPVCLSSTTKMNTYQPTPYADSNPGYASALEKLSGNYRLKSLAN